LWPVIVGGLLTMGGGLIAGLLTIFTKWIDLDAERRRRHVDKVEQLVSAVYEHDQWIDEARSRAFRGETVDPISPLAKIEAISAAYFPAVRSHVVRFKNETNKYIVWIAEARMKTLRKESDTINDGLRSYLDARGDLIDQIIDAETPKLRSREISSTRLADWWSQGPGRQIER
jgi:hypothetical protein